MEASAQINLEHRVEPSPPRHRLVMTMLLLTLPMFGETFHYLKELLPLWTLSKAFPILSLPFAFWLLRYPRMPMSIQILISFSWLVIVSSFAAVFSFDQNFFLGLSAQVKLLPMLYFFTFLVFLLFFQPSREEITRAFVLYGLATFVIAFGLWLFIPDNWYSGHYVIGSSTMFSDDDRGHRIRMPMFFGIIFLFHCYRRFLRTHRISWLLGSATGFVILLTIVKTRAMIIGVLAMLLLNGFVAAGPWLRILVLFMAPLSVAGLFSFSFLGNLLKNPTNNGLSIRIVTTQKATDFLGDDPLRWLLGVGTISPASSDSLESYFSHFFFLADITWTGIVFEFGLVGALILLLFELRGIAFYNRKLAVLDSDFLLSLRDYVVYCLLISELYPLTLSPGESATIFAIFVYVWHTELRGSERKDFVIRYG